MILVDTSVWIELLNAGLGSRVSEQQILQFRTCGPVAQEVLQGLREELVGNTFRQAFMSVPLLGDPVNASTFSFAAQIYRLGRRKGYTIRSSIDCLIAAIAIENDVTVWHRDRDFATISTYTALRSTQRLLTN